LLFEHGAQVTNMFDDFDDDDDSEETTTVRPQACGVLAFHSGTEAAMFLQVERITKPGFENIQSILLAIDNFCSQRHWMMHVGPQKASIICNQVESLLKNVANKFPHDPLLLVEIGSYCGYSCVMFSQHFLSLYSKQFKMVCIEGDPACVEWTRRLVKWCGLEAQVEVIESVVTKDLAGHFIPQYGEKVDVLFIDHDKARYAADLISLEQQGAVRTNTVVVADNILSFGNPLDDYLNHVRDPTVYSHSKLYESYVEYSNDTSADGVEISVKL